MKYIVYCILLNKKRYIGYTKTSLEKRRSQHIKLSQRGSDQYLHRAIRKHGPEKLISFILFSTDSHQKAIEKEKHFIKFYSATNPKKGYNMTTGGDGGDCVSNLDPEKKKIWHKKLCERSRLGNNPKYSGYSDKDLINFAVQYFVQNGSLGCNEWFAFSKTMGYPQNYSKNRFNGSFKIFKKEVQKELNKRNIRFSESQFNNSKNSYSLQSRKKIAKAIKGRKWYNNGSRSFQIFPSDPKVKEQNLKPGRLI